jgi:HK97 family phage prohead protease
MDTKHLLAAATFKADDEKGAVEAVFSTFDIVDSAGDIVAREAFTDGQKVPMVWAHDWTIPIGKGEVRVERDRAVFAGQFFLDTDAGAQAYRTVKNMGELQEYSWGFRVLDAHAEERDAEPVRVITKAEVFEVSPVLVGANRRTYTLSLKSGLSFLDQSDAVLAAAKDWAERARSLADLRTTKAGRVLSEANRRRIKDHADGLLAIAGDLTALYDLTAPPVEDEGKAAALAAVIEAELTLARLSGVAV